MSGIFFDLPHDAALLDLYPRVFLFDRIECRLPSLTSQRSATLSLLVPAEAINLILSARLERKNENVNCNRVLSSTVPPPERQDHRFFCENRDAKPREDGATPPVDLAIPVLGYQNHISRLMTEMSARPLLQYAVGS